MIKQPDLNCSGISELDLSSGIYIWACTVDRSRLGKHFWACTLSKSELHNNITTWWSIDLNVSNVIEQLTPW
jgi:hypothetical protein